MQITFNLPHVFHPGSSPDENAHVLRALLDCLTRINLAYLRSNHAAPNLYRSGVVYGRTEIWDAIPALYKRGFGDCKSLSCALAAEYLQQGIKARPVFRWIERGSGSRDFHIVVEVMKDNRITFEDPSKVLGMGHDENVHFNR